MAKKVKWLHESHSALGDPKNKFVHVVNSETPIGGRKGLDMNVALALAELGHVEIIDVPDNTDGVPNGGNG